MLCAAREVVEEEDFEETLENVRARVDEIESLHRTNEVTVRLKTQISAVISVVMVSDNVYLSSSRICKRVIVFDWM